ncbi:MAG: hypothetical protein ACE5HD_03450 [Acidobacteriota bacterium]
MRPQRRTGTSGISSLAVIAAWLVVMSLPSCAVRRPPALPLPGSAPALAERRPPVQSFRALVKGIVRARGHKVRFMAGLGALPPGFRLDLFHPGSRLTLLSLGVNGEHLRAVWPQAGECLDEKPTAGWLRRLVGLHVAPAELLPLLSGNLYRDETIQITSLRPAPLAVSFAGEPVPAGRDRMFVEGRDWQSGARYEAELLAERDGRALQGRRIDADGSEIRVEYPGWVQAADPSFSHPSRVRLQAGEDRLRLQLEIQEWAPGGPPPALLLPALPEGCRMLDSRDLEGDQRSFWRLAAEPSR